MLHGYDQVKVRVGRGEGIDTLAPNRPMLAYVSAILLRSVCEGFNQKVNNAQRVADVTQADVLVSERAPAEVHFVDDDPRAFDILMYWVYFRSVASDPKPWSELDQWQREHGPHYYRDLIHAWILGNKYGLVDFQNLVMLELLRRSGSGDLSPDLAGEAFQFSPPGSPLQRFVAVELVYMVFIVHSLPRRVIEELQAIAGVHEELQRVYDTLNQGRGMLDRLPSREQPLNDGWKEYMVGGRGPEQHWIYRDPSIQ